jgi:hypothetical protein
LPDSDLTQERNPYNLYFLCGRAEGVVEHVVLLGAPVPVDNAKLRVARSVAAGRFVNGFCRTDWLLSLCCR